MSKVNLDQCRDCEPESEQPAQAVTTTTGPGIITVVSGPEELQQRSCLPGEFNNGCAPSMVLVVEPDAEVRGLIRCALQTQGFKVCEAISAREGLEIAIQFQPGAALLDLGDNPAEGLVLIRRLREWSQMPILALSARTDASEAVAALDQGANDYITKPFRVEELCARLRAALRFAPPTPSHVFQTGSLTVDLANRVVRVGNNQVNLSATEYSLLRLFVRHAGKILTHTQILSEVWGAEMRNQVNYLRVYLRALRKKLEIPTEPSLFITQRAVGYGLAVR